MKNFVLILFVLMIFSPICRGDDLKITQTRGGSLNLNLTTPGGVAQKANKDSAFGSEGDSLRNPMLDATTSGFANMIQGFTGGSYNALEQQKQQMDYAKQNSNAVQSDE